jgi:hypothetical protein
MKRHVIGIFLLLVLPPGFAQAQVRRVEMKIDGYLCGY